MKNSLILCIFFLLANASFAQTYYLENRDSVYTFTDKDRRPDFPGGIQHLSKIIRNKIGCKALANKIIRFRFTVDTAGKTKAITITDDRKYFSKRKIRKLQEILPKWLPAIKNGSLRECNVIADIRF